MGNIILKSAITDFTIQWLLFIVAAVLKTEKFYDLAGSATFLLIAFLSLQWGEKYFTRQKIQSGMVMMWALRLGLYLFTRIMKEGKDKRFDKIRGSPKSFFIAWTIQGVWVLVTLLPTLILNAKQRDTPLGNRDYFGWALWAVGFFFEVTADYQKSVFRNNPDNAGKFINSGLWSLCRHPNYFGEILLWTGLYVSSSSTFKGWEFASVLSPVFIWYLLTNISGVPMLEKAGLKKWGSDPAYLKYLQNTPSLIPKLF